MLLTNFIAWQPHPSVQQQYALLIRCLFYGSCLLLVSIILWFKISGDRLLQTSKISQLTEEYYFWNSVISRPVLPPTAPLKPPLYNFTLTHFLTFWMILKQLSMTDWRLDELSASSKVITLRATVVSLPEFLTALDTSLFSSLPCVEYELLSLSHSAHQTQFVLQLSPKGA